MNGGLSEASCAALPGAREGKRVRLVEAAPPTSLVSGGRNGTSQPPFLYPSPSLSPSSILRVVLGLPASPTLAQTLRIYASYVRTTRRPVMVTREKTRPSASLPRRHAAKGLPKPDSCRQRKSYISKHHNRGR